jgi:hypothetical protein
MSTDVDDRLRHAFRAIAEDGGLPDEAAAWQAVRAGIDGRSGRRRWVLAGGAALASAAVALGVVLAVDDPEESVDVTPPATQPPASDLAGIATRAVVAGDEIRLSSQETGAELGVLATARPGRTITQVDLSANQIVWLEDDGTLFLARFGEEPAAVADGVTAAALHDPGWLAYATVDAAFETHLVVVDVASDGTPVDTAWDHVTEMDDPQVLDLDWSPDGRLLVTAQLDGRGLWLGNPWTQAGGEFEQLVVDGWPAGETLFEAEQARFVDGSTIVAVATCCFPFYDEADVPAAEAGAYEGRIARGAVLVELATGRVTPVDGAGDVVAVAGDGAGGYEVLAEGDGTDIALAEG